MKPKTLFVLFLILVALSIITVLTTPKERKSEKVSLIPETTSIEKLTIENAGSIISLVRKGDDWFIEKPIKTKADDLEVDSIMYRLQEARSSKVLEENPKNLKKFGIEGSKRVVKYEGKGGKGKIVFGNVNPTGEFVYVLSGGKLFLTDRSVESIFKKTLNDLREKRIFWGNKNKVCTIVGTVEGKYFKGKKTKKGWKVLKAPCKKPNPEGFQDILDDFGFLRFEKLEDKLKQPKENPLIHIQFLGEHGKNLFNLLIYPKKNGLYPTFETIRGESGYIEDTRFDMIKEDIEGICKKEETHGSKKDERQKGTGKKPGKRVHNPKRS